MASVNNANQSTVTKCPKEIKRYESQTQGKTYWVAIKFDISQCRYDAKAILPMVTEYHKLNKKTYMPQTGRTYWLAIKFEICLCRSDSDAMLPDANLPIGYPMVLVVNSKIRVGK
jgi:hypothetical protein